MTRRSAWVLGALATSALVAIGAAVAIAVAVAGGSPAPAGPGPATRTPSPIGDPDRYAITAIDYHFHDAHPTEPLEPGRILVVTNQGRNLHNVTIPALSLSTNVRPGRELVIGDVAASLAPGRYPLTCRLHADRGMNGVIVIADR